MPKVLTEAVIAESAVTTSVAFAYEPRGDPPVLTLMMLHTYMYRDKSGTVVEHVSEGKPVPPDIVSRIEALFASLDAGLVV